MIQLFNFFYKTSVRFPRSILFFCVLFTFVSLWAASKLQIENRLSTFLPKNFESVRNVDTLKAHFGGTSYLVMVVEQVEKTVGYNPELKVNFARKLAQKVSEHPLVLYVDFEKPVDFFKNRQWLYLDISDLEEMERRIARALELEQKGVSPTFQAFMKDLADPEDNPDLTFGDILRRYENRLGFRRNTLDQSLEEQEMLILRVKSKEHSENLDANRRLVNAVKKDVETLKLELRDLDPGYQDIQVSYSGGYQSALEEFDQVKKEIFQVSVVVTLVLGTILFLYFRRLKPLFLIGVPLAMSVFWTGAFAYWVVGHLNMITSFVATILGGIGSDYGIYLITRYEQERRAGRSLEEACHLAFSIDGTARATYYSMLSSVAAFFALMLSGFRIFVELGLIGGVGLVMSYVAMLLVIPASLVLWDQHNDVVSVAENTALETQIPSQQEITLKKQTSSIWNRNWQLWFSRLCFGAPKTGLVLLGIACVLAGIGFREHIQIHFESNQLSTQNLPANKLDKRVDQVLGQNLSPTLILAGSVEEEARITQDLERLSQQEQRRRHEKYLAFLNETAGKGYFMPEPSTIVYRQVLSLFHFVPQDQELKKEILKRIYSQLSQAKKIIRSQQQKTLESLRQSIQAPIFDRKDLPIEVRRFFEPVDDSSLSLIYLFPAILRDGSENLAHYMNQIHWTEQQLGRDLVAVDNSFVAYDALRLIRQEAPKGLVLVFCFLGLILFLTVQPVWIALSIVLQLGASLWLLFAVMASGDLSLNIINIGVIPILLDSGVDCFIHFYHRFHELKDLSKTVRTYLPAIVISNFTTLVGFAGLIFTSNVGLRSIGWTAVLGITIITALCALVFPRVIALFLKRPLA